MALLLLKMSGHSVTKTGNCLYSYKCALVNYTRSRTHLSSRFQFAVVSSVTDAGRTSESDQNKNVETALMFVASGYEHGRFPKRVWHIQTKNTRQILNSLISAL